MAVSLPPASRSASSPQTDGNAPEH